MSRSRRKTPIRGNAAASSEKDDKRQANKALRRRVRTELAADPAADVLPVLREVSEVWAMAKDGKHRINRPVPRDLRK